MRSQLIIHVTLSVIPISFEEFFFLLSIDNIGMVICCDCFIENAILTVIGLSNRR